MATLSDTPPGRRRPAPATARLLAAMAPGTESGGRRHSPRARAIRAVTHVAVWAPFLYAVTRALHAGWRPVSDTAVIALRSWDTLTAHGLLVGEATRLAHGVYDLGPLEFWLLTIPVHADPGHGVLWGAAAWCMVAGSLAVEAAWSAAAELGAVLAGGTILGLVAWLPGIAMVPAWNPWFGGMFFIAALATGWAVLSGRHKWWPALVVTASVAAQAHLMYAVAAAGLLTVGLLTSIADSRRSGRYRWLAAGIAAGLACWAAPLIQEVTAPAGNLTQLIGATRGGNAKAGLSFGLRALSAATQPPAYWWQPTPTALKLSAIGHRTVWFGAGALAATVLALIVAIVVLRSRRAGALAAVSLLTSAAALETYSGIPAANLSASPTDLSYLLLPMFPLGVLTWLTAGAVVALSGRMVWRRLATRSGAPLPASRRMRQAPPVTAPWAGRIAGLTAVALIGVLAARAALHTGGGALANQRVGRAAVSTASAAIERDVPPGRLALVVAAAKPGSLRQVTMGLAYTLRTAGYTPQISAWAFQLGPAYASGGGPGKQVTVFVSRGGKTRVVITPVTAP